VLPPKPVIKRLQPRAVAELDEKIEDGIGRASALNKAQFDQFIFDLKQRRKEFNQLNQDAKKKQ
jgi:hypothetical protein